jgi:hypothetical protein|tara:strand:- start:91 stop:684 length:594 start_codon:yes stop_codon:yes gene_type:complete
MKKIFIFFLLFLNLINAAYSQEIRSRFGFYLNVPNSLIALHNVDIDKLLKEYEGKDVDKSAFNDIMAGATKEEMTLEYFFPKDLDPVNNSININVQKGNINDVYSLGLKDLCPLYQKEYSRLFKKKIKQYECKFITEFSPKFNSVIYLIHDGIENYLIQYQFQVRSGIATLTVGCDTNKNCNTMSRYANNMINSIKE